MTANPTLTFLGGTGTVTGSKYLLEWAGRRVLVDCGLFQGWKELRLRNWAPLPVDPKMIDAVVLTHAHLDHSGYLPLLVKNGFKGPIHASHATQDLCGLLLRDSGHIQEADARYANKKGFSKHKPALPLYTQEDAEVALEQFEPVPFDEAVQLADFMCPRPSGKSNRAILVNIGAGWCLPCQAETLEFPELYAEYHDQGLEIVQVMFQDWEALAPTGSFCDEWSSGDWSSGSSPGVALEFPVLIDQVFDWGSIYLQDPASATPINMLIDANGNIRWKLVGQQPPLDVLRAQIELVIEEPYAPPA